MAQESTTALGEAVRRRREQLGISIAAVRLRGGPSEPTVIRVEHGKIERPSPVTLAKLDTALQWVPGSAGAVADGGEPTPLAPHERPWAPGTGAVSVPVESVTALVAVADRLGALAREDTPDTARLAALAGELGSVLQPVYGAYVTHLLERNRAGAGELSAVVAMLENLLADLGPDEDEERVYRRWLAGMVKVPPEKAARFESRWKAAAP